jgi:hypothetical protein
LKGFLSAHQRTRQVQDQLLSELLHRHAATTFAADHNFASIRSYEDFKAAVPIRTYDDLRPYMDAVLAGQTTALLPPDQPVLMFSRTSGTTGKPKHIPVTPRFLSEMRRGWNIWGLAALLDHKAAWLRPILQISSPMHESDSPTGKCCGAISGLLARTQKPIVRRMYVVPACVLEIPDPLAKCYATLRCAIEHDVSFITTANPSSTIKLIETGQQHADGLIRDLADGTLNPPGGLPPSVAGQLRFRPNKALARRLEAGIARDGHLLPRHFWNVAFLANWTGGTLKLYLPRLRELFNDAPVRDIGLLASEGRFSIPMADDTSAGVADILGNFLEFIPAGDYGRPNPPVFRADELEVGQEYFLVVTNWAGLWRYSLDDRIRVTGRLGQSPVFEFLSRGLHTANITGEKITEHQVVEAMRRACAVVSARVERFVVQGRFAREPYYELRLEQETGLDMPALAAAMDAELMALNIEYASKRKTLRLGPVQPRALPPGAMEQAERERIRQRLGRGEQYKHQYLLTDVLEDGPGN